MMRLPQITSRLFVLMTADYSADVMSTQFTSSREARQVPTNSTYHCASPKRPDTMAAQYPIRNLRSSKGLEEELPPRKGIQMVQRTSYDHPPETSVQRDEATGNVARESCDRELKLQPVEQDKSAAINNWLSSKICGKAC